METNEMECLLHTQENDHHKHEFCAQNEQRLESNSLHDVPLQHIHNLEPPFILIMHSNTHSIQRSQLHVVQKTSRD